MNKSTLARKTIPELIELFAHIGVAQDEALLGGEIAKFNRLFDQMAAVSNELKRRSGDQRSALRVLYDHTNMQVRLKAAIHTLSVLPLESRRLLQTIAESKWFPQAGDAGMTIRGLDEGTFKPT